ncbi:deoxyribodipyrimidine photo-lyase-like [Mercenaria mercenaria]|uniref:deoxyribodipyrimidine photo-lyase-like n=1 Tax=Mercenaria mercenaria TaxID=6596 RepID=UPI00234E9FFE|nr:deoxyribodipyrimidine photo-lyase-like [Mercenaria mercenaria]
MDNTVDVDNILTDFKSGNLSADECFCMILSLIGYDAAKTHFLAHVETLRKEQPKLHNQLFNVYRGYFECLDECFNLPDKLDCSVENGFYATDSSENQDIGFDLDLEMALKLSLESAVDTPSYASKLMSSHTVNGVSDKCHEPERVRKMTFSFTDNMSCEKKAIATQSLDTDSSHTFESSQKSKKKKNRKKSRVDRPLSNAPLIYWFRRDLRLYDNPALEFAALSGAPVLPIFLWSDAEEGPTKAFANGGATKYWLHMALPTLNRDMIDRYNNPIIFRKSTDYLTDIVDIIKQSGAKTLVMNDVYEPYLKERDDKICKVLRNKGVKCERFHSYLLHQPGAIKTESLCMRGMGSVTHFMECCRQSDPEPLGVPVDPPNILPVGTDRPESVPVSELGLGRLPKRKDGTEIDWARVIRESWDFSENGAWEALQLFLNEGIRNYEKESSRGDKLNTCRISPYLHFGQISPRTVLNEGRYLKSPKFLRKLAWRDLSYWLLSVFPDLPYAPTRPQYQHQRWSDNKIHLKAWQKGNTGYPLVDASMRQLWLTGWMNNYMRHVVASFLISYLHITWVEGYLWFQDTLLDADVAINAMMWQNGGMSGLDQWNFVMHPVDAAMTCDPKGDYVRKWIPELARMPEEFIHKPWKCPPSILRRAGVELGVTYPHRIITNLEEAREQSLRDVVDVRQKFEGLIDPRTGNDLVQLPNGVLIPVITRKEFKYKTRNPESRDNPHSAVLRGYRSRKRDELVEYLNQRDFMASTMKECSMRHDRGLKASQSGSFY